MNKIESVKSFRFVCEGDEGYCQLYKLLRVIRQRAQAYALGRNLVLQGNLTTTQL